MLMPWYMELKGEKEGEGSVRGAGGWGGGVKGRKKGRCYAGGIRGVGGVRGDKEVDVV